MRSSLVLILVFLGLSLSGCYDYSRKFVQQGNLISAKKIQRLRLGMTKEDAAILMGTSLLSPTFDENRWDYAYTLRTGAANPKVISYSLYFSKGVLTRIEPHQ